MNIPKIIFRNSAIFDSKLLRDQNWKRPEQEKIDAFVSKIKSEWELVGDKILEEMSLVTKLPWQEEDITCYVTYGVNSFSHPLTINMVSTIHDITHELIHCILSPLEKQAIFKQNWSRLMGQYDRETNSCKTHIAVHAVHAHILEKIFGLETLKEIGKSDSPDYKESWEIVYRDGYENIIAELTKGL